MFEPDSCCNRSNKLNLSLATCKKKLRTETIRSFVRCQAIAEFVLATSAFTFSRHCSIIFYGTLYSLKDQQTVINDISKVELEYAMQKFFFFPLERKRCIFFNFKTKSLLFFQSAPSTQPKRYASVPYTASFPFGL